MIRLDEIDDAMMEKIRVCLPPEDTEGCWLWSGSENKGYPRLKAWGRWVPAHRIMWVPAHRIMWVLANAEDLPNGEVLHHDCGVKLCCRPDHLRRETQGENLSESDGANAKSHPLEAVWREAYQDAYGHPAGIDRGVLVRLQKEAGELGARWAIRAVVGHWPRYCRLAAHDFGLWCGDYDKSPNKPVTGIFRNAQRDDAIAAAVQLGRELYRETKQHEEQERRRREYEAQAPQREAKRKRQQEANAQRKAELAKTPLAKWIAEQKTREIEEGRT